MILRTARHTHQLPLLKTFYTQILGLEVRFEFQDHDGYDGLILGKADGLWEIEFTQTAAPVSRDFDADDLLVLYPQTDAEYQQLLERIENNNLPKHNPQNPYWKQNGLLLRDPDGFGVIISPLKIKPE